MLNVAKNSIKELEKKSANVLMANDPEQKFFK